MYFCAYCNYTTKIKCNFVKHHNTKKHIVNVDLFKTKSLAEEGWTYFEYATSYINDAAALAAAAWKKLLLIWLQDLFQGDESAFGNGNPPRTVGRNLEADEQRLI